MLNYSKSLGLIMLMAFSLVSYAQQSPVELSKKEIIEVIQSLGTLLNKNYVYPDQAKTMSELITNNHKQGKYQKIKDVRQFAEVLQQDLRSVSDDKHLVIDFNPEDVDWLRTKLNNPSDPSDNEAMLKTRQQFNFGFETVQILKGNIGYLKLNGFSDTDHAAETAIATMNFLSHTDAIIFDLRKNGGGSPKMVQLISSYLFSDEPVHLSGFYWRAEDKYTQSWTLPYIPGKRSPDTDVYVLTSSNSFSAAEEFSYNLKHLNRATIIGEVTAGGAHPTEIMAISDRFTVWLPNARSTNPITKMNWESVGVIPHIKVPADQALAVAKTKALEKLSESHPGESGDLYRWYLVSEKAALNPVAISSETLQSYVGKYGPITITVEGDQLYFQREGDDKLLFRPLEENLFELVRNNSFRLKLIKQDGQITALQELFDNGFTSEHPINK